MTKEEKKEVLKATPFETFTDKNGNLKRYLNLALKNTREIMKVLLPKIAVEIQKMIEFHIDKTKGNVQTDKTKIKLLEEMDRRGISRDEYCLTQSSILSIMGIRDNDDLDIIISSKLRNQNPQFPPGVDVFAANRGKFNYFGAKGDDDILENYCIKIDGYKFLEPRFYFSRKH